MRVLLFLLLAAVCALAEKNDNRRNKLPFVADAVGNSLPPPSNMPATVGSPVNLLTPDRYEFYTFDESGELVKRLMTLEEIQAIVAAGEEAEGLVTFANENQPTVSFNINQPPYTKVHSVVTNVQNVLKAQMEAHKNKPHIQPTLDTPDVSDSWSLILPSIFGNTGVDIVLDKSSGSVTTPETETIEELVDDDENSLSKEGNNNVLSSTTKGEENIAVTQKVTQKEKTTVSTTTSTSTTTTTTTPKPVTTTKATTTTRRPVTSTTKKPTPASISRVTLPSVAQTKSTNTPRTTTIAAKPVTPKPVIKTTTKSTPRPVITTKKPIINVATVKDTENIKVEISPNSNSISSTPKNEIEFEKISTFVPISTVKYVTEHTTLKPKWSTKPSVSYASTTKRSTPSVTKAPTTFKPPTTVRITTTTKTTTTTTTNVPTTQTTKTRPLSTTNKPEIITTAASSTAQDRDEDKMNATTITTQSVSPSTTVSSTEFLSADKVELPQMDIKPDLDKTFNSDKDDNPLLLFDVAQSISQIASDLGSDYQPIPTSSNLLDTTNVNGLDLESKENLDMDIPSGAGIDNSTKITENENKNNDNFIQISTIDPHNKNDKKKPEENSHAIENTIKNKIESEKETAADKKPSIIIDTVQKLEFASTIAATEPTTIDPIMSESMGDLLSQVVNQAPSIIETEKEDKEVSKTTTTEKSTPSTTVASVKETEATSEISNKVKKDTSTTTTTEKAVMVNTENESSKLSENNLTENDITKQTEITSPKLESNNKTDTDSKITTTETNDQKFIQISGSDSQKQNKDESNTDDKITTTEVPLVNITKINIETTQKPETTSKDHNKTSVIEHEQTSTVKITTLSPIVPESNIATNKNTQSKINIISPKDKTNVAHKKDKLPEPLPKVDDFKKKIQKVNIDEEELINHRNNSWKLIPTVSPPKANEIPKDKVKSDNQYNSDINDNKDIILEFSNENQGLEVTTKDLGEDLARFSELSNELAFRYWNVIVDDIDKRRSFVFSPYSTFSMLAMIFMGARGATSGEMNEILKLDDMVTFNPHFTLKNISDSIETSPQSGVAVSAFIRELYSDRNMGKILTFYKERAQHFYNGHVEEINFKLISDIIRRRTNLLVKRYTWGKIPEYMKTNNIVLQPPLAAFTANIFQTDCSGTSVDGRDGEMYFVVSPNVRQRRLVPVPAVVYKKGFLAGYDPVLDVTVAALGNTNTVVSTLFLMPGQQGNVVHADDLEKLEQRLLEAMPTTPTWNRVLRTLLPRNGLELQIPRFSHKSTFNTSQTLKKMGLKDLFDGEHADLGGLNGPSKDLYLSDMVQLNMFVTCGEGVVGEQHHIEEYPETLTVSQRRRARWLNDWDEPRDYQRAFHDPHDISDAMHLPLHLRPRQARVPARSAQAARLKFDRPFLYFVRHNPSGMILYFGRYNPRLLP